MTVRKKRPQKKSAAKANHVSPSSHKSQPAITRAMLRQATNSRYFERGEGYFDAGLVHALKQKDGKVYATVDGSHPYCTTLWVADGTVEGTCTCPLGQDHEFCKHLVATGLTWIESQVAAVGAVRQKRIEPDDIEAWLRKQSPDHLVETIMSQAMTDNEFYNVLKFRVAAEQPAANITEMRSVLRQAMVIDDFVSWREASDYARGVDLVIDRLKAMADKHPTEVLELVEYALVLWEEAIECIDSDGEMGMIMDDLLELHLDTCQRAKPIPEELAVRLFYKYINSGWDIFRGAYETYGRLFGKAGKAKYRELVEEEWSKLPRIKPGEKNDEQYGRAGKLKGLMQMFAEQDGDLDALVGIMSRDLSEPYSYLNIAERYRKAHKHKEAIEYLDKTHKLMYSMGQETEFKQDLLAIKTEWKRLRNFIKYVERRK